jgi:hypothetical protein
MYGRLVRKVPQYLARRVTLEEGRALLASNLANRERNFLQLAQRSIYGQPSSPYLAKLREAGCELGDLRRMVEESGIEETLLELYNAGVRIGFEEFKGRAPTRLAGQEVLLRADQFNNPYVAKHLETSSSGSTGVPARNPKDLDHLMAREPVTLAIDEAQGFHGLPTARVTGIMPFGSGPLGLIRSGRYGHSIDRWFVPEIPRRPELRYRWAHRYLMAMAQLYRVPVPQPEPLPLEDSVVVAEWAAATLEEKGPCLIHATVSMALRIAIAAQEAGIDLTSVTFRTGAEPMTEAKMAIITATGAGAFTNFSMSDVGKIGFACMRPHGVNDQHLMIDHLGVIQAPRTIGGTEIHPLVITTLLPSAPRIFFNVEIDDFGILERRACGCPLEKLGLHTHVRDIRSFGKLTAEGVTLVGSEMERILESELPSRFGGTPLDYQLVEEEDENGFTRLYIVVSPAIPLVDEQAVVDTVLAELERSSLSGDLASRQWHQADVVKVRREQPALSGRGKMLLLRRDRPRQRRASIA